MNDPLDPGAGDSMFTAVPIFVTVIGAIVVAVILFALVKGIAQWNANNNSPVLTARARVVTKRVDVHRSSGTHGTGADGTSTGTMGSTSTTYFATFEDLATHERIELRMRGTDYGQLAQGDVGDVTHQGTRYKGFARS